MSGSALEYDARKKSAGVAYFLLIFVGMLGVHRFYLDRTGSGVAILLLSVIGLLTSFAFIGLPMIAASIIWCIVDLFRISEMVQSYNLGVIKLLDVSK